MIQSTELPPASQRLARVRRLARFIVGGGLNTGVTYLIYLALHIRLSYQLAYLVAYLAGIAFSYCFNSIFVFRKNMSWGGALVFPAVYAIQYAVSAMVLGIIVEQTPVSAWAAPLIVSVLTLPLTYVLTKLVVDRFNR